jgi:DNA-binding Xre family transcriptional regulator
MQRRVSYTWRLRELMISDGIGTAAELPALLTQRGVHLSRSQAHRLVSGTPVRISLPLLAALCDLLACSPADLIIVSAEPAP